ncbi:exportin [Chloropicon primus]|uniref:Exportin-4 n=1 Tax=Chloropicon primus TaxID=1764295 RepID=A0A5B8MYB5_9CHLO|nr:exportin [Chloropicon primus]|eukprot:QDZ25603.1 exportin [Chloropicon primus]
MEALEQQRVALEQAALELQSPKSGVRAAAEAKLKQFRALPIENLFQLVARVVEATTDVSARFHAVQALRTTCVERWPAVRDKWPAIRDWSVESALHQKDEIVRSQLLALCAVLSKRSYLETGSFPDFARLRQHCGSDLFRTQVELELMQSIVSEFSHETASSIGMPFAFHHECKERFQISELLKFFDYASSVGKQTYFTIQQAGGNAGDQLYLTTIASLETMVQILQNWDFRKGRVPSKFFDCASTGVTSMSLKPGKEWRERLLLPEQVHWVYELCHAAHTSSAVDTPLASTARQLIVILASLHGDVFLPDNAGYPSSPTKGAHGANGAGMGSKIDPLKLAHLSRVQVAIQAILDPCDQIVQLAHNMQNEQRLRDGCTALCCLSEHNRLSVLVMAAASSGGSSHGIGNLLSSVTLACLGCGGARDDQIDSAVGMSLTALLEAWEYLIQTECIVLSMRQQSIGQNQVQVLHEESGIKGGAALVFRAYLDSLLHEAAETALDDLDEEEEEQSLEMRQQKLGPISSIARVAAGVNFELLCHKLVECQANIAQHRQDEVNLVRFYEQLCCLLELVGYCIADPMDGEVPLIPILLSQCHDAALRANGPDPVVQLSNSVLEFARKLGTDPGFQQMYASSRILECSVQCLAKWTATYLMSEDAKMPSRIREAYTLNESTRNQVMDIIVRLLGNTFVKWMGEMKVQEQVCKHLLPSLVQGRQRRVCLINAPAWNEFLGFYVQNFDALSLALRGDLHRSLVKFAIKAATRPLQEEVIKQYLQGLMDPMLKRMSALESTLASGGGAAGNISMQQVEFILEGLRGGAQSFSGIGLAYLLDIFINIQPVLLNLLKLKVKSPRMVYLALKLTAEVIGAIIADLDAAKFGPILNFVYEILNLYKKQNMGAVSLQRSKDLKDEEEQEKYKNIRALLKLLVAITEREMVDFTAGDSASVDVASATFIGLGLVLPLLSREMLSGFPKLAHQYFDLVCHLAEVYPENVCRLPPELFTPFVETLRFGVGSTDQISVGASLDSLYHIMKTHLVDISKGGQGLGGNMMLQSGESLVSTFMKSIWHTLIYENFSSSSYIEQSSSVLLVMMLASRETFQEIGSAIINGQAMPESRAALENTLNTLSMSITAHADLTRQSRRKFSREFQNFIVSIRGIAKVN